MVTGYKNIIVVIIAIILHIIKGLSILISGTVTLTTGVAPVAEIVGSPLLTGSIFLTSGLLAVIALYQKNFFTTLSLIALQHIILLYSLASAFINIYNGYYSDGFIPMSDNGAVTTASRLFIFNDQILQMLFVIFYSLSLRSVYAGSINQITYKIKIIFHATGK